ncbi:unnamed protein product [Brassicogethes aeneus]|uniref:NADH dehydrogenase [ubiquinone] 1 subunit C2 n=1 Tax=Brassicogethes aeneus TaxID=1431903 RepID=A0A9P0BBT8_BRAAE|nr:unnamed protein product [Brassicogethes aeneus]
MAQGPKIPQSPLELLDAPQAVDKPFLTKTWGPASLGVLGFVAVMVGNYAARRPMFSGIQWHIIGGAAGVGIGWKMDEIRNRYLADRDAVYRHYITLHPEDFPAYERKKIGDMFQPWIPVR